MLMECMVQMERATTALQADFLKLQDQSGAQIVRRECTAKILAKTAQIARASHAWREISQHILAAPSVLHAPGESTRTKAIHQVVLIGHDVYIHKVWARHPLPRSVAIVSLHKTARRLSGNLKHPLWSITS